MKRKMKGIGIRDILCSIVIFLIVWGISACICYRLVQNYADYDMDYSDFTYEELTYVGYEKEYAKSAGPIYRIYFKEYDIPFIIDRISEKKLDIAALKALEENETVRVYYYLNQHSKYEIGEISSDKGELLNLSGFVETHRNNEKVGIATFLILGVLIGSILAGSYLKTCNAKEKEAADHEPMEE